MVQKQWNRSWFWDGGMRGKRHFEKTSGLNDSGKGIDEKIGVRKNFYYVNCLTRRVQREGG